MMMLKTGEVVDREAGSAATILSPSDVWRESELGPRPDDSHRPRQGATTEAATPQWVYLELF